MSHSPLVRKNPLYLESPVLLRRKSEKHRGREQPLTVERARRFVMPYGVYQGYYAHAVVQHDVEYAHYMVDQLSTAREESCYDEGVKLSSVLSLLLKERCHDECHNSSGTGTIVGGLSAAVV